MAAPTLVAVYSNVQNIASTSRNVTSVAWNSGDLILVKGNTEDNSRTLTDPTNANLTFSALSGFPSNISSRSKEYCWQATAGSSQTGQTISGSISSANRAGGYVVEVWRSHGGVGAIRTPIEDAGTVIDTTITTTAANSALSCGTGDWDAAAVGATPYGTNPGAATNEFKNQFSGAYSTYFWYHADAGTTGSKTIQITSTGSLNAIMWAVEILGSSGTTDTVSSAGATAGGLTGPSAKVTSATGGATAGGATPSANVTSATGGATAGGATGPSAIVTSSSGGAVAGGTPPTDSGGVTDVVSLGGAVAGGTAPTALAGPSTGGAVGGGVGPTTSVVSAVGGAVAGGTAPSASVGPTAGGGTAGGIQNSGINIPLPLAGGLADGNGLNAAASITPGGAIAGGISPSDSSSTTDTVSFNGAVASGNTLTAQVTSGNAGAVASGNTLTVQATSGNAGALAGGTAPTTIKTIVGTGGAIAGGPVFGIEVGDGYNAGLPTETAGDTRVTDTTGIGRVTDTTGARDTGTTGTTRVTAVAVTTRVTDTTGTTRTTTHNDEVRTTEVYDG